MNFVRSILEAKDADEFNKRMLARTEQEETWIDQANKLESKDEREENLSRIER